MNISRILRIALFTLRDELQYKSFYVLAIIAILFVLLLRGCFSSDVVVNNEHVDAVTVGWHASLVAFHIIAGAGVLFGLLLGMRVMKRDKDNGMLVSILSRPVSRMEYVTGKIMGIWVLASGLTFLLHMTVYIIMLINTGGRITFFIPASLLISLNVLFAVVVVVLFSLLMPDVIAALLGIFISVVSFISDSLYAVMQTQVAKSVMEQLQRGETHVAVWRVIWPKIAGLQYFATSLIQDVPFVVLGPVNPVFNVLLYTGLSMLLLYWRFMNEEVA